MKIFENIVGQGHVIEILRDAVVSSRKVDDLSQKMTHSWLFTGSPGSGRLMVAKVFAAALVCSNNGCGQCVDCQTAMNGSHLDIDILRTEALSIKVEEIRDLISLTSTSPSTSSWRIVIIQDAQRLTEAAANALLKAIEEPSSRTIWILTNISVFDLQPTIKSRCRQIQFSDLDAKTIAKFLMDRSKIEKQFAEYAATASQCDLQTAFFISLFPEIKDQRYKLINNILKIENIFNAFLVAEEITDLVKKYTILIQNHIEMKNSNVKSSSRNAEIIERRILSFILNDLCAIYFDLLRIKVNNGEKVLNSDIINQLKQKAENLSYETIIERIRQLITAKEKYTRNIKLIGLESILVNLF